MSEKEEPLFKDNPKLDSNLAHRRGKWESSLAAVTYINSLGRNAELKIRQSDHVTALSLFLASIATVLCLLLHNPTGLSFLFMALCDFFLGVSLTIYICNRLGVLTALPPRQASLVWQLLKAFSFVGLFIAVNLALILSVLLSFISSL